MTATWTPPKKLAHLTDEDLDFLIVGARLRREQLRRQAEELPKGTAKGIAQERVDHGTRTLTNLESLRQEK